MTNQSKRFVAGGSWMRGSPYQWTDNPLVKALWCRQANSTMKGKK